MWTLEHAVAELVKVTNQWSEKSWVQILAESVIVEALGKSISTAPSYQRRTTRYSEGTEGTVAELVDVLNQWPEDYGFVY